ncbi:MAG: response regulator [Mucilaginibacter sp.]|nr:response regulator [Mucilaginibacter sp.]
MEPDSRAEIYVIDDQPIDTVIAKLLFKRFDKNLKVHTLENGKDAIDMLTDISRREKLSLPDYIFLDLDMPRFNGWQFLNAYAKAGIDRIKRIPIYILTSSLNEDDIQRSLSNPFVEDFISKPLSFENIKSIVHPAGA